MGADQQTPALFSIGKEGRLLHVQWLQCKFGKQRGVLLVPSGLESIAEVIECHIRVDSGTAGSAMETLIG